MGYSCTTKAAYAVEHMMEMLKSNETFELRAMATLGSNAWKRGEDVETYYFFERGREQGDGAITGTVYKVIEYNNTCRRNGSVRVEPDGTVTRFPTSTKDERVCAKARASARSLKVFNVL